MIDLPPLPESINDVTPAIMIEERDERRGEEKITPIDGLPVLINH